MQKALQQEENKVQLGVLVILLSGAMLLALVLTLTLKPDLSKKFSAVCMTVAIIGGLIIYGTGIKR